MKKNINKYRTMTKIFRREEVYMIVIKKPVKSSAISNGPMHKDSCCGGRHAMM